MLNKIYSSLPSTYLTELIKVKRIYERPSELDGYRILVDRLWPRGISKEGARIDLWLKDVAPSRELRTWFGHDPRRWDGFRRRYRRELSKREDLVEYILKAEERHGTVTLLFAASDTEHNNALVLKEYVEELRSRRRG